MVNVRKRYHSRPMIFASLFATRIRRAIVVQKELRANYPSRRAATDKRPASAGPDSGIIPSSRLELSRQRNTDYLLALYASLNPGVQAPDQPHMPAQMQMLVVVLSESFPYYYQLWKAPAHKMPYWLAAKPKAGREGELVGYANSWPQWKQW